MPIISYFFGIIIKMYFDDHQPPHFHAEYQGREGIFSINESEMIDGNLPTKAVSIINEWARGRRGELLEDWNLAKNNQPLKRIPGADND